ncbi:cyclic nucleotide-binding domain-containing protein [Hymenobacter cheonanensis]|uniref:cyclic nucleotide-binding domain-containing protein n=1 Tax=Hymenobacter sp. CA2-7 TaxID=3063993 RepID=UPI0027141F55|nr:cyclic nucleotide-binding domain-containing protein [Hymenobacter sp. CA2-7]MDO7887523.1 cyclic nucleotide-binding domain-containing protein [Hymenobacter sp. CA2-7]
MTITERGQRLLGVRPDEGRTVWLFFLHNFLLGVGTILVYVAANVLLLENNPERNLPLAYGVAALAMLATGQVYAHFEHHWLLQKLAVRVLLAAVALTGVLGVLVATGHSVAAAVAIMAGYRVIYLLTNLEFWGVSAVVFDVRQGKRLFGIISAGDMPAKAMGAVLAIFIHSNADLPWLLGTAFGAYLLALLALRATLRSHVVEAAPVARRARPQAVAPGLRRWFGDSQMVQTMCLSLLALAAVTTGIEYLFFVNVKHRFHDEAAIMRYVGTVLVSTYLVAMLFKLLLSQHTVDRLGVRWVLLALPVAILLGLGLYGGLNRADTERTLLYFCGLYLGLEVLRRAVFDPVFLLLFQPLTPTERLQAHTLAKGLYEPLGMALGGGLLFALHALPGGQTWAPFLWMGLLMAGVLLLLLRTYRQYVAELQHALSRRFADDTTEPAAAAPTAEAAAPAASPASIRQLVRQLPSKASRPQATQQLLRLGDAALPTLAEVLSTDADQSVVRRVAQVCGRLRTPASRQLLVALARQPHLFRREMALRALRHFDVVPHEVPLFQALVHDELQLGQQLLHGQATASADLASCLDYELLRTQQRVFALLGQIYPPQLIADAQRGVANAARERQANALEILDNSIARPTYQGLQALLSLAPPAEKERVFDRLLGPLLAPAPIVETIMERGETAFTDWTVRTALDHWQPTAATVAALSPHLRSASLLVRESAFAILARLASQQPSLYQQVNAAHQTLDNLLMSHAATTSHISAAERVAVLQQTALFAETPENVLSSIVPIMHEVSFAAGQQIFAKGDLGASLFIVYEGQVGIFNGAQQLATFGKGDFFGELALLDAEPRSASAVAQGAATAFRLDQEDFYDVMEERPEVLRNILRVLCQRLRRQNEALQVAK